MRHSSQRPVLPGLFMVQIQELPQGPRQTQQLGRIAGNVTRENLWSRMLHMYDSFGSMTDAEMAFHLTSQSGHPIERSTVNARRNELVALRKVVDTGTTRKNQKSGVANVVWGLRKDV